MHLYSAPKFTKTNKEIRSKKNNAKTQKGVQKYGFCILKTATKTLGISKNILHRKVAKFA